MRFLQVAPVVPDSGEGRWTALESIELGVPAPAIAAALVNRILEPGPLGLRGVFLP